MPLLQRLSPGAAGLDRPAPGKARLQWHHLPLPGHKPQASALAGLAECAGAANGQAGYWAMVDWIYQNTRGGQGLPEAAAPPGLRTELTTCLQSSRPQAVVRQQAEEAMRDGIIATPTLRLLDSHSGQALLLPGPVEGDALLSALDLLSNGWASSRAKWHQLHGTAAQ